MADLFRQLLLEILEYKDSKSLLRESKKTYTKTQIEDIASMHMLPPVKTAIPSRFEEIEYLTVTIKPFVTCFFLMDNETFNYTFSHVYNAKKDTTSKKVPSIFL